MANLIIVCPDQPGIVAAVTGFLYKHGANIATLEQHIEDGYFFMRAEWQLGAFDLSGPDDFNEAFAMLKATFKMETTLDFKRAKKRVGLFCSKDLHCLIDIIGRMLTHEMDIEIPYVISNNESSRDVVTKLGLPFFYIPAENAGYESECLKVIKAHPSDLIGLARYMKILSPVFIEQAKQPIINIHHSFLPSFVGAKPYAEAYERGVKIIGATAHFVTAELDQGPIIEQRVKTIRHNHTIEDLKLIGRECEKEVFAFALKKQLENKLVIFRNRTIVFE